MTPTTHDTLWRRAKALGLQGLIAHWDEVAEQPWVQHLIDWEEYERQRKGFERRLRDAKLGTFKAMADFDWRWPKKIDREQIEDLFTLDWIDKAANVILMGPNGVGKSMIARNLAYEAVRKGHHVRFLTASELLNDLVAQTVQSSLNRRLRALQKPQLLCIDEVGYLSYDNRHADLFFEVITRRYNSKAILLTTNKGFSEWSEVFPNATCVVTLVDRLIHHAEIVQISGDSYRLKESRELAAQRVATRKKRRAATPKSTPATPHTNSEEVAG